MSVLQLPTGSTQCEALELFSRISSIPGYFNANDALHFSFVLGLQRVYGIAGDILEIGTYFGRSAAFLATGLSRGERIHICDAFKAPTRDQYKERPGKDETVRNILGVATGVSREQVVVHDCLSKDLKLPPGALFRIVHVDAGHNADEVAFDLELSVAHLAPGGILIIDDYMHKQWPGVTEATTAFLAAHPELQTVTAVNRWFAHGQKLYVARPPNASSAPSPAPGEAVERTLPNAGDAQKRKRGLFG